MLKFCEEKEVGKADPERKNKLTLVNTNQLILILTLYLC